MNDAGRAGPPAGAGTRWGLARYPSFWLACAVLFMTNAVISAFRADWWLVGLEAVTALFALVSAAAVAGWHRPRRS